MNNFLIIWTSHILFVFLINIVKSAVAATPPSQRVQFLLGQDDGDEEHMSHDIFCEMEELRAVGEEGDVEWKETAR